jgi:hypothetical protein
MKDRRRVPVFRGYLVTAPDIPFVGESMDHDTLVSQLDAQADEALKRASGENTTPVGDAVNDDTVPTVVAAPEQNNTGELNPALDSQTAEPPAAVDSPEEQPIVPAVGQKTDESNLDGSSLEGLSPENAAERIRNADAMAKGAQRRMTEATQEAATLREEVAQLKSLLTETRRIGDDMRKQVDSIRTENQGAKGNGATPTGGGTNANEFDSIRKEYGEDFNPLLERMTQMERRLVDVGEENKKLKSELSTRVDTVEQNSEADREADEVRAWKGEINTSHPGAFDLVETVDFQGWLERQAPAIQGIYQNGTAPDVVYMLNLYKRDVGEPTSTSSGEVTPPVAEVVTPEASPTKVGDQISDSAREAADPSVSTVTADPSNDQPTHFDRGTLASLSGSYDDWVANEKLIDEAMAKGAIA